MTKAMKIVIAVSAFFTVVGVGAWQLALNDSGSVGLTDYVSWGLANSEFLALEALAAGTLFFSCFGEDMRLRKILVSVSLASSIGCVVSVFYDVGAPEPFWRLFFAPHFQAPMALDVWFFSLAIVLGALYLFVLMRGGKRAVSVMTKASLAVAVLMPLGTSILFTTVVGRVGWSSPLEVAIFELCAVVVGLCFVALISKDGAEKRRVLLGILLGAYAFLIVAEIVQSAYTTGFGHSNVLALMTGQYAWMFWLWIVGGIAAPLALVLAGKGQKVAAVLTCIGVVVGKYVFIVKGSLFAYIAQGDGMTVPSMTSNSLGQTIAPPYVPGLAEWGISLGSIALTVLVAAVLISLTVGERASKEKVVRMPAVQDGEA